jgi:cytochrome oxidase Cu insertion factor (SCO1/SenC/PrrC family)
MNSLTTAFPARAPARKTRHATLIALAAIFFLPFIVGSTLFWLGWRPAGSAQHGELVVPARPLPESGLQLADGRPLPTTELRRQWLIAYPLRGPCGEACRRTLRATAQVHAALGKEQDRVGRIAIATDAAETRDLEELQRSFPDLAVAKVASDAEAWRRTFAERGASFYLVDPQGKVMMRYDDDAPMRGVLKDLERLLKYAWIR